VDYWVVSGDIEKIGMQQAQYYVDAFNLDANDGKTYTMELFAGSPTEGAAGGFFNASMSVLQPYFDSGKLVCESGQLKFEECAIENWATVEAQNRMDNILTAHYSDGVAPDFILSPNDSIALGIFNALKNAGYEDSTSFPAITGQDCDIAVMKLLNDGFVKYNIFKNIYELGQNVVDGITAHYNGEEPFTNSVNNNGTIDVPCFKMDATGITPENWYNVLVVETGFYTLEQLGMTQADLHN